MADRPTYTTPASALQAILDVTGFLMEYGRVETGTPESAKLIAAYGFLKDRHGIKKQSCVVRKNPDFYFFPKASDEE